MKVDELFCPNLECPARGQVGEGNLSVHSQAEQRVYCEVCQTTFSTNKGTIFYRLKTAPAIVIQVLILLSHGCPVEAVVAAFGLDPRTVRSWWARAGQHCEAVHQEVVGQSQLDLGQVQLDEIKVKTQGKSMWMALSMQVSNRLWLGGAVSPQRDKSLLRRVADQVRSVALCRPLLAAVDGLSGYVSSLQAAFRSKIERARGQVGRCQLRPWSELNIVQVIKRRTQGHLEIERKLVQGDETQVTDLLQQSQAGGQINTAFIERLNATFRQRLSPLTRRTRHLVKKAEVLTASMFILGCCYNLCDYHQSLSIALALPNGGQRWLKRTPAIAAGLTDHRWSMTELFYHHVPPPPWTPPKRRGRHSHETQQLIDRWCKK